MGDKTLSLSYRIIVVERLATNVDVESEPASACTSQVTMLLVKSDDPAAKVVFHSLARGHFAWQ